jgi:O-antigen ligase
MTFLFFALFFLPLVEAPAWGYDALRLPAALLASAAALGAAARTGRLAAGPVGTALAVLVGLHVLSLGVAVAPAEGARSILTLGTALAAFAAAGAPAPEAARAAAFRAIPGAALAAAGLALVQVALGLPPVALEGNTNYAGALAAVFLPPVAAFALRPGPGRAAALAAAAATTLWLALTGSRGGAVGAGAGLAAASIALFRGRTRPGATVLAAAAVALVAVPAALRPGRYLSEERLATGSVVRLEIWKGAARLAADRPILGAGAGNFAAAFPPYRGEAEFRFHHAASGPAFVEVEDAHSSWAQIAAETGVPGFLAWIAVAVLAARLWRSRLRAAPEGSEERLRVAGVGGGIAAYLAAGLFNTLTLHVSPTILFGGLLGLLADRTLEGRRARVAVGVGAALSLAGALVGTGLATLEATLAAAAREPDPVARERLLERAEGVPPGHWRVPYLQGKLYSAMGRFDEAAEAFRRTLCRRPAQLDALNSLAVAILKGGGDEREAQAALLRAIGIAPYAPTAYFNLGLLELGRGRLAEARRRFEQTLERHPRHGPAHYYLGTTLLGDPQAARACFRRAREEGFDVAGALRRERPALAADPAWAEFFR